MQHGQMDNPTIDITWIFLQSLFMAVNTLLWSISYPDVRAAHPREEVEELLRLGINVMERCTDRWPGSQSASGLYQRLGKACLKAYEGGHYPKDKDSSSSLSANSPASAPAESPYSEQSSLNAHSMVYSDQASPSPHLGQPDHTPPLFNFVFNQSPDNTAAQQYHQMAPPPTMPTFRSNSIFNQPATRGTDRRFSFFPPDVGDPSLTIPYQPPPPPQPQPLQQQNHHQNHQQQMQNHNQQQNHQQQPPQIVTGWENYNPNNTSPPLHNAPSMGSTGSIPTINAAGTTPAHTPRPSQGNTTMSGMNTTGVGGQLPLDFNFNTLDEHSYFIQPTYNFGPATLGFGLGGSGAPSIPASHQPGNNTFDAAAMEGWGAGGQGGGGQYDRMDSLTYDQQIELMQCLEGEVGGIDEYLGLVPGQTTGWLSQGGMEGTGGLL